MDGIQIIFAFVIELCRLITGDNIAPETPRPLSPAMMQEIVNLNKTLKEYKFLCENNIDSPQDLVSLIGEKREQISDLKRQIRLAQPCEGGHLLHGSRDDRYSHRKVNPCHDGRNTEHPAGLQICGVTKRYGVTNFSCTASYIKTSLSGDNK